MIREIVEHLLDTDCVSGRLQVVIDEVADERVAGRVDVDREGRTRVEGDPLKWVVHNFRFDGFRKLHVPLVLLNQLLGFHESISASFVVLSLVIESITVLMLVAWAALAAGLLFRPPAREA